MRLFKRKQQNDNLYELKNLNDRLQNLQQDIISGLQSEINSPNVNLQINSFKLKLKELLTSFEEIEYKLNAIIIKKPLLIDNLKISISNAKSQVKSMLEKLGNLDDDDINKAFSNLK